MRRFIATAAVGVAAIVAVLGMTEGTAEARSYVSGYFAVLEPSRDGSTTILGGGIEVNAFPRRATNIFYNVSTS